MSSARSTRCGPSGASRDDLEQAVRRFDEHEVTHGQITRLPSFGIDVLSFEDPDGIQLELTAPAAPACGRRLTPPGRRLTHAHGRASVRRPGASAEGTGAGREVVRGIGAGPAYCRRRQGPCSHADRTESRPPVTDGNLNGTREPPICTGVGWSPVQATPAHSRVLCALKNWLRLSLLPLGFRRGRD
jgi:hypothetical protein